MTRPSSVSISLIDHSKYEYLQVDFEDRHHRKAFTDYFLDHMTLSDNWVRRKEELKDMIFNEIHIVPLGGCRYRMKEVTSLLSKVGISKFKFRNFP